MTRCLLVPLTAERDYHAGFLELARGDCFRLSLRSGIEGGRVDPESILCDPALQELLRPFARSLRARCSSSPTLAAFTLELCDLADDAARAEGSLHAAAVVPAAFYELLVLELGSLGWDRLGDVISNLSL